MIPTWLFILDGVFALLPFALAAGEWAICGAVLFYAWIRDDL